MTVKVDTGLNRNGVSREEWTDFLKDLARVEAEGAVRFKGVFSHLAHADEPHHPVIDDQRERFTSALEDAERIGLVPEAAHLSNSAATLTRPDLRFDMVRPGIAIYGLSPVPDLGTFGLRPVMTFRSRVALVKKVAAGEGVSYGHTWVAPHDTTVALLPVGYADGIPRALGGRSRCGSATIGVPESAGSAWTRWSSTSDRTARESRRAIPPCSSATVTVTAACPTRRTGRTRSTPSTTRW